MSRALAALLAIAALAVLCVGCAGDDEDEARAAQPAGRAAPCPAAWKPGWQRLANRAGTQVFCPSWMPNPLTGEIGGDWDNGLSVRRDGSYLVSFLWHEAGNDVHVNFRGYPGRTQVPRCQDVQSVDGKTHRRPVPCFSDPQGPVQVGRFRVTLYTANRGIDQWHLLYAWHHRGSLYTVSEHVAPPFTLSRVRQNLDRMMRGLALIRPAPAPD